MSDKYLFFSIVALFTVSLVFTYSLSAFTVLFYGYDDLHFFIRQAAAVILGIGLMAVMSWMDPDRWFNRIGFSLFILSLIAMMAMPFLPESIAKSVLGAKRWIHLGPINISPVEFFKVGFIFFVSWSFSRRVVHHGKLSIVEELKVFLPYLGVLFVAILLIAFIQNDLGQVIVLAATLVTLFIMAGRTVKIFFVFAIAGAGSIVLLILSAPHRIKRILSWWSMIQDRVLGFFPPDIAEKLRVPQVTESYQISNSLNAFFNGSYFGQGLGNGQFKLGYLSEVHTDFILAGISEELGLLGLVAVTGLILFIIFRILLIASGLYRSEYYLYTIGTALMIFYSFIVNSYGISGLTPIKGIAVPLLSYGGSQIIAGSIAIGLVLMVSKKRRSHGGAI